MRFLKLELEGKEADILAPMKYEILYFWEKFTASLER